MKRHTQMHLSYFAFVGRMFFYLLQGSQNTGAEVLVEQLMWCVPEVLVPSRGFGPCAFVFFPSLFSSLSIQVPLVQGRIAAPMSQLISRMPPDSGLTQARQPSSRTDALSATRTDASLAPSSLPLFPRPFWWSKTCYWANRRRSDFTFL